MYVKCGYVSMHVSCGIIFELFSINIAIVIRPTARLTYEHNAAHTIVHKSNLFVSQVGAIH